MWVFLITIIPLVLVGYEMIIANLALRARFATNADCRLADWQVNEENFVVECFNRVPIAEV